MSERTSVATTTLRLPFIPPYNWAKLIGFLAARTIPGVEAVGPANSYYRRTIQLGEATGVVEVQPLLPEDCLLVTIYTPTILDETTVQVIAQKLTTFFDLKCDPQKVSTHFQADPYLGTIAANLPGLRVPGAWDSFELAVRAILGQQVSVQAARTLAGRIVQTYGTTLSGSLTESSSELCRLFPSPQLLAKADLSNLGIIGFRAKAINGLATALVNNPSLLTDFRDLDHAVASLQTLPGVGLWTAQYIAMRALHEPDAFPLTDLVLLKVFSQLAQLEKPATAKQLALAAQKWQPWRAYAAMYLWNTPLVRN